MKKLENITIKIIEDVYQKNLKKILLFLLVAWGKLDIFIFNFLKKYI